MLCRVNTDSLSVNLSHHLSLLVVVYWLHHLSGNWLHHGVVSCLVAGGGFSYSSVVCDQSGVGDGVDSDWLGAEVHDVGG